MKAIKQKKCVNCKAEFPPAKALQRACSFSCALEYAKTKTSKKEVKDWNKKKKQIKEKLKTLGDYEKEAKRVFQKWIRLRDAGRECISCGTKNSPLWDAGHLWKAEIYSGLIFNEDNVHKQCGKCNRFLGGNEGNYRIGLVKRYGAEFVARLESLKDEQRNKKFTKSELIEIKKKYQEKLKIKNAA